MNDMRGISWLPLRRWLSGTRGRRNAPALSQTAKKQAQGHWMIADESQMLTASDLLPYLHLIGVSVEELCTTDDETHIERGTE